MLAFLYSLEKWMRPLRTAAGHWNLTQTTCEPCSEEQSCECVRVCGGRGGRKGVERKGGVSGEDVRCGEEKVATERRMGQAVDHSEQYSLQLTCFTVGFHIQWLS